MRRLLAIAIILSLALYGATLAGAHAFRRDLIYPFDATRYEPQHIGLPRSEIVTLPATEGAPALELWVARPRKNAPIIVYFMGNVGNLGRQGPKLQEFALRGLGVVAMAYRGGGGAPGRPTEAALKLDSERAWAAAGRLFPDHPRVIYGVSLGSGLAVALAAEVRDEAGVVLEAPFTRLCDVAEKRWPLAPACLLLRDERYDNLAEIGAIGAPLLILHGAADRVTPLAQGEALLQAAAEPKELIVYEMGRHSDLRLHGAGVDAIAWINHL